MKNKKLEKLEKETVLPRWISYICAVSFFIFICPYIVNVCCNGWKQYNVIPIQEEGKIVCIESSAGELQLPLEEYLIGVIGRMAFEDSDIQFFKAMAVVLRSNIMQTKYTDFQSEQELYCTNVQLQERWGSQYEEIYGKIKTAVAQTARTVMVYEGEIVYAPFFYISAGKTRDGTVLGVNKYPYLKSVDCMEDVLAEGYLSEIVIDKDQFANSITIENTDQSGYVLELTMDGIRYKGEDFRQQFQLASAHFHIEDKKNKYKIVVKGNGHGFGLSIYGANTMAKKGYDFQEILLYYYTGVRLDKQ